MALAFFERLLHGPTLDDFQLQRHIGGGQFHRALAEQLHGFVQVCGGRLTARRILERSDRLAEKKTRPADDPGTPAFPLARQHFRHQDLLMQPRQIHGLEPGGLRLLPPAPRRLQIPPATLPQVS